MNTDDIRRIVQEKIAEEKETNHFRDTYLANAPDELKDGLLIYVQAYLEMTPHVMDVTYNAAANAGLGTLYQPIYDASFNYWMEQYDYIPDHIGMAGICDDAYLTCALMDQIARSPVPGTGEALISDLDIHDQNINIGRILGDSMRQKLDAAVVNTIQSVTVQNSLNQLFGAAVNGAVFGGLGGVAGFGGYQAMHNILEQQRIEDNVNTQLGAMGIF